MVNQDVISLREELIKKIAIARNLNPKSPGPHRAVGNKSTCQGYAVYLEHGNFYKTSTWIMIEDFLTGQIYRHKFTSYLLTEAEFNDEVQAITLSGGN